MLLNRAKHRYMCSLDVDILAANLESCPSQASDISEGGAFLIVPGFSVAKLNNAGQYLSSGDRIKIAVPNNTKSRINIINCKVTHSTAVDDQEYLIGVAFIDNQNDTREFIEGVIQTIH